MIPRQAASFLDRLATQFPIVLITGPRQSGKTTFSRFHFATHRYLNFENLDTAERAREDPRGFLAQYGKNVIFDEVQRVPSILSYIQEMVDNDPSPGSFILTGSQHFGLTNAVNQSLAGRTGLLELLPFSAAELDVHNPQLLDDTNASLRRGWYPPIIDRNLDPALWYENYISTYLERDVRQIEQIRDLSAFRRFLMLCAGRTAQLVNLSELAGECGVSHNTIKAWISVLEASYLVKLIQPYHKNFNKRLVKTPKLYFLDTGLAARLLGIRENNQIENHPLRGALFETLVFAELVKIKAHTHAPWDMFFWRDQAGNEVDFILESPETLAAIEVKSGATFHSDYTKGLSSFTALAKEANVKSFLVYSGKEEFDFKGTQILCWKNIQTI